MKNTLRYIILAFIFIALWEALPIDTAALVMIFFVWMLFGLDASMLGYLGFAFIFGGITASLFGILAPTERLLNYGLFFLFMLILLGLRDIRQASIERADKDGQ